MNARLGLTAAALCGLAALGCATPSYQTPSYQTASAPPVTINGLGPGTAMASQTIAQTATGAVQALTYTQGGQIDGFLLDDGTRVHFEPVRGDQTAFMAALRGQPVEVRGWLRPDSGATRSLNVFEVHNRETGERIELASGAPGQVPQAFGGSGQPANPITAFGKIESFTYRPDGAVNGFALDDGLRVRVPVSAADRVESFLPTGQEVRVDGLRILDREGAWVLQPQSITNQGTHETIDVASGKITPTVNAQPVPQPE